MKKIYYNKLIRDPVPERIIESNGLFSSYNLDENSFIKELLKKVGEEASALPKITSNKELVLELADIIDVIEEIKKVKAITNEEVQQAQQENFRRKGGFEKRIFLEWTSDTGYKTNEYKNETI